MGSQNNRIQGLFKPVEKASPSDVLPCSISPLDMYTLPVCLDNACARFLNRTGGYVSGTMKIAMKKTAPEKMAISPSTHLHPSVIPKNPETIGPKTGPMNGAILKTLIARPRSFAANRSATTPPALVRGLDPKAPPKNRRMRSVQMF